VQVDLSRGISLVRRTGVTGSRVGTLFELQKGSGTIGKALCAYRNGERGNPGPTFELFEVFRGFRRKGYGKLLLEHVTNYFEEIFLDEQDYGEPVNFNVCYCTNRCAAMWFMRQGFQNWDGINRRGTLEVLMIDSLIIICGIVKKQYLERPST
jgi:GNAT superfamily N-acetyltransferase